MKPTLSTTRPLTLGMTPPWVIAHRGNSSEAPENTEPAFIQALEAGVEAIELDVQLSKDGLPIVWHDRDLKKLGLEGTVADHPAMVLKGSDAGSWFSDAYEGQAPLALQEVLRRYGGQTRLLIEIKAREHDVKSGRHLELASKVGRLLRVNRLVARSYILSFNHEVLAEIKKETRNAMTVPNFTDASKPVKDVEAHIEPHAAISANIQSLTPAFAEQVRAHGKPLMTYVVNDDETFNHALKCGCDAIMSDRAAWLVEQAGLNLD